MIKREIEAKNKVGKIFKSVGGWLGADTITLTDSTGATRKVDSKSVPSEDFLKAANTFEELDFLIGLQQFKTGTKTEDMVKYVTAHKGLGLTRIADLVEVAKVAKKSALAEDLTKHATNDIIASEFAEAKELKSAVTNTMNVSDEAEVQKADNAFHIQVDAFMDGFINKFMGGYFDQIKTMDKSKAAAFLTERFQTVSRAIVEQFDAQYRGTNYKKSREQQEAIRAERNRRGKYVLASVTKHLGDFFQNTLDEITRGNTDKKREITEKITNYNEWQTQYAEATEYITAVQEENKAILGEQTQTIEGKASELAETTAPILAERDDVGKKHDAVTKLHESSQELSEVLTKLSEIQATTSRENPVTLGNEMLQTIFSEEYEAYQAEIAAKKGTVTEAETLAADAKGKFDGLNHKGANKNKKQAAKVANEQAQQALANAKATLEAFMESLDRQGGFIGYLLTSCIKQIEGFGVEADTEASIKELPVEEIEKLTKKITLLTKTLKTANNEKLAAYDAAVKAQEAEAGSQPGA